MKFQDIIIIVLYYRNFESTLESGNTRIRRSFSVSRFFKRTQLAVKNTDHSDTLSKKLVIIGDGNNGNTAILHRFKYNVFEPKYELTIFETLTMSCQFEGQKVNLR